MEKLCLVYITASDEREAVKIGDGLVDARLAACVNICREMTSVYRWDGKKEKSREAVIIAKTKESILEELENKIKELHSYSCPCIIAVPIVHVNEAYGNWIIRETK